MEPKYVPKERSNNATGQHSKQAIELNHSTNKQDLLSVKIVDGSKLFVS